MRLALLVSPSHNRVYSQQAPALARAELAVIGEQVLRGEIHDLREEVMGSVPYLTFEIARLSDEMVAWLSRLSATFALFELADGKLTPLALRRWARLDSDLVTIQKYAGKTNESFTHLLLNVTLAASPLHRETRALSVLDPFCGRGTTLNQALLFGYHATGVEHDKKDFEAYGLFIQRWVKDKRLKHQATLGQVKGRPKLDLQFAHDKERYKLGDVQRLTYVNADTLDIAQVFQPRSFDLIVTDAPYGVQHGAKADGTLSRKPLELLRVALPVWRAALRSGGAIGIAWNTLVAPRRELQQLLTGSDLSVCDSEAYRGFAHRVDHSIQRDLIVAVAP